MTFLPLIRHDNPAAVIAYRDGKPIEAAQFLADVRALGDRLPQRTHVVNRCADRYHFAVAFGAALIRGQITLLPPNDTAESMRQLVAQYSGVYCVADAPAADACMDQVLYPPASGPADTDFDVPSFDERQIAALIFTSGSVGQPTPHEKRWGNLVRSVARAGASLGVAQFSGAAVLATVSPQHSYGLESSVMLALQHRLALTPSQSFYPADIVRQLEIAPRPRILVTTPIHLRFLMADSAPIPPVDLLVSATASLSPQLAAEAEARFCAPLMEIYGCAEVGQTAYRRPTQDVEWHCIEGINLSEDEQGAWARGDIVERETLLNDVIELHGPDHFTLHGRKADLVNIVGKRTSLAHLNYHLNAIPGVKDGVFVVPQESDDIVTRLIAFVVAPTLRAQAVKDALRERIDPVFLPRPLCLVDVLPRNATGKLARTEVDKLLAAHVSENAQGCAEIVFAGDLAATVGHFPGDPIVPGAILLQEIMCVLQDQTEKFTGSCEIRAGKFLHPVRPGDHLEICWAWTANGDIRFDCFVQERAVVTGVIGDRVAAS